MSTVAIISSQYFWLPEEAGPTRFYSIAEMFQQNGYSVDVITSSFEHHEKKQRDRSLKSPFNIIYIDCPSYKKNVGFEREKSNIVFTRKVKEYLEKNTGMYDVVYCSIPPNNISAAVADVCKKNHIPLIVDIEDLWPEAMQMILPKWATFAFFKYKIDAEKTYRYCDGVVGTSEEYSLRAMLNTHRKIPYRTVYVGNDIDRFDEGVREYLPSIEKEPEHIWVTYAGSLGVSYDIATLIKCAQELYTRYPTLEFQILGSGPRYDEFINISKERPCNVKFWGYVKYEQMAAVLSISDILINSVVRSSQAGIINKIGDYLAAGKPMINTGSNLEFRNKVEKDGVGINVEAENVTELKKVIIKLIEDQDCREQMGKRARIIAKTQFDRKKTYQQIVDLAEELIEKEKPK